MRVVECCRDCIDTVSAVLESSMSRFHTYYATSCIDAGVCRGVVAYEDSVVGVGVFYPVPQLSVGVVYYVVLLPKYRGRGIGSVIVASIEEILEEEGNEVFIATTREGNVAARNMLRKLGYVEVALDGIDGYFSELVTMLTCGYEDDLLYLKPGSAGMQGFFKKLLEPDSLQAIERVWRMVCYDPWRRLRAV